MGSFGYWQSPGGMRRGWIWANFTKSTGPGPTPPGPSPGYDWYNLSDLPDFFGVYRQFPDNSFVTFPPCLSFGISRDDLTAAALANKAVCHFNLTRGQQEGEKYIAGYGIFKIAENAEAETAGVYGSPITPRAYHLVDGTVETGIQWGGLRAAVYPLYKDIRNRFVTSNPTLLSDISGENLIPTCDIYLVYHYQNNAGSSERPVSFIIPEFATMGSEQDLLNISVYSTGSWPSHLNKLLNLEFWGRVPSGKVEIPENYTLLENGSYMLSDGQTSGVSGLTEYPETSSRYNALSAPFSKAGYQSTVRYLGCTSHGYENRGYFGGMFVRKGTANTSSGAGYCPLYFGDASSAPPFSEWTGSVNGTSIADPSVHSIPILEGFSLLFVPKRFAIKTVQLISSVLT